MTSVPAKDTACALCASPGKLKQSHLIPQFVYRGLGQPGGPTQSLLCGACEARFSLWESRVASEVFHPLVRGQMVPVKYGPWLLGFATSVCWRILENTRRENTILVDRAIDLTSCLQTWRDFLRTRRPDVGACPLYLVREFGVVSQTIAFEVGVDADRAWIHARLGPLVLSGLICGQPPPEWNALRLHREGKLKLRSNRPDERTNPK